MVNRHLVPKQSKNTTKFACTHLYRALSVLFPLGRHIIRVLTRGGPEVLMLIDRTSGPALCSGTLLKDLMISAPIPPPEDLKWNSPNGQPINLTLF